VRIHSLPQEWLWCETWCSDESKPSAKTIDLCNNPLTKAPKLDNAVRIVDEWTDYDLEVCHADATETIVSRCYCQIKALEEKLAEPTTTVVDHSKKSVEKASHEHTEL
jgi:hypothetical protein